MGSPFSSLSTGWSKCDKVPCLREPARPLDYESDALPLDQHGPTVTTTFQFTHWTGRWRNAENTQKLQLINLHASTSDQLSEN